MKQYSIGNPPPIKVGDLLYIKLQEESGFGIITDIYTAYYRNSQRRLMKVFWSNACSKINQIQDHDILLVDWNLIEYLG